MCKKRNKKWDVKKEGKFENVTLIISKYPFFHSINRAYRFSNRVQQLCGVALERCNYLKSKKFLTKKILKPLSDLYIADIIVKIINLITVYVYLHAKHSYVYIAFF